MKRGRTRPGSVRGRTPGGCGSHCVSCTETTPNPQTSEEEKTETAPTQEVASPEQYIKHPLQNRWALWFFKNDKSKTWQANLRLISKFDTVEDFWALYNHIQLSSNLMPGCDYSLFKDGIEPMWEDEKNKRGGRWLITLTKQQRRNDLDRFWLETGNGSIPLITLLPFSELFPMPRYVEMRRPHLHTVFKICCALSESPLMTTVMMYVALLLMLELKVIK
ncbi:eukaryotic translation initiation factor 4E isoform X3 [Pelodiscus sinensis]|uniref:eukaryotic translation initiation factor 4E isoform X3 n=1 Tax=Pelodiscus sinensis TaxID=13735 RepID=UPI003F6B8DB2